ncbi:CvpA family protein [Intestinibacillus massiliensis]|nr:CvpA family protein [Intestinibacillus massiliensis]
METIPLQLTPETLKLLLSPSDLVLLAILLANVVAGLRRGFSRTLFGLLGKIGAFFLAAGAARFAAPYMARYLVTPIVGDVFQKQAQTALSGAAGGTDGASLFGSLSATLQSLLDADLLAGAAQPLKIAAQQAAQRMAESLSYFLLFFIFLAAFACLLKMAGEALHLIARATPLGVLDALGGGAVGLVCGLVLSFAILWALARFSPALFSELGPLSPAALDKTLLTKSLLGLIPPGLLGSA